MAVQIVERWILARLRHRRDWFERLDAPVLKPLPVTAHELARFKPCRVNIDYHVEIDAHYYSVPHNLVRQQVEVREAAFKGDADTAVGVGGPCPSDLVDLRSLLTPRVKAQSAGVRIRPDKGRGRVATGPG